MGNMLGVTRRVIKQELVNLDLDAVFAALGKYEVEVTKGIRWINACPADTREGGAFVVFQAGDFANGSMQVVANAFWDSYAECDGYGSGHVETDWMVNFFTSHPHVKDAARVPTDTKMANGHPVSHLGGAIIAIAKAIGCGPERELS